MQQKIFIFGLISFVVAGCGSDLQGGGSGGSGAGTTASSGTGGAAGTGGGAGMGGSGGAAGSGGAGNSSSSSSSGGGCGFCDFTCCGATCANLENDIKNCGACGAECLGPTPYCDKGVCSMPPCDGPLCGPAGTCCGSNCCMGDELCCTVPGPIGVTTGCFMPTAQGTCPTGCTSCRCAAPDTPIATPTGEKAIESLVEGDLVYSVHRGAITAVPIRKTQRNPVSNHHVKRVELTGGRVIEISDGHPTADGHSFADLSRGSSLGGVTVVDVRKVAYGHPFTYDILPDSDTGTYFAAGALIGSTMATPPVRELSQESGR